MLDIENSQLVNHRQNNVINKRKTCLSRKFTRGIDAFDKIQVYMLESILKPKYGVLFEHQGFRCNPIVIIDFLRKDRLGVNPPEILIAISSAEVNYIHMLQTVHKMMYHS